MGIRFLSRKKGKVHSMKNGKKYFEEKEMNFLRNDSTVLQFPLHDGIG
jgi:hypothetical protein